MKTSKFLCVGPGGTKCSCCFPAKGSKARKAEYRRAKLRESREQLKHLNDILRGD